jgi:hypothetical protein
LYAIGTGITKAFTVFTIVLHGSRRIALTDRQAAAHVSLVNSAGLAFDNNSGFSENNQ